MQGWGCCCFPGGCKAPLWGWEEDGRDARGFDHPPLFPSASLSFDYSSFSPCRSSPGLSLGRLFSPQIFGDHLPCRGLLHLHGDGTHTWLSELGWVSAGREREHPPLPRKGTQAGTPLLGGHGTPRPPPPPFPSPLGSNLGVRAPSLYKPWGEGGSPGMAVAASGWEGEVYFVYE